MREQPSYTDEQVVEQPRLLALPELSEVDRLGGRPAELGTPALPLSEGARKVGLAGVALARQALSAAAERAESERAAARASQRAA